MLIFNILQHQLEGG